MFTFLRTIRRSLIESSSARKYLLYAVGEIALVVIGILLALQINNWNENRIIKSQLESYLIKLQSEVKMNMDGVERRSSDRINQINKIVSILESLNSNIPGKSKDSLISSLVNMGTNTYPPLARNALDNLTKSNLINSIKDEELIDYINYNDIYTELYTKANSEVTDYIFSTILPYYFEHSNLVNEPREFGEVVMQAYNFGHDTKAFVKNRELSNILKEYVGWMNYQNNVLKRGVEYFEVYGDIIDQYLKENY